MASHYKIATNDSENKNNFAFGILLKTESLFNYFFDYSAYEWVKWE
jgi:hypothetical protein